MPERLDLIIQVFNVLDEDGDGRLDEEELLKFARCYDFIESDEKWSEVYGSLCTALAWDESGVGVTGFIDFVENKEQGCYCEDEVLQWMLKELSPTVPEPATSRDHGAAEILMGQSVMNEVACMQESMRRLKSQGFEGGTPAREAPSAFTAEPAFMGMGIPGLSAADAEKLIAAGGKKPAGHGRPGGAGRRLRFWREQPWLQTKEAPQQDLDPLGFDSLPDQLPEPEYDYLDPLGFDSLPDDLEPARARRSSSDDEEEEEGDGVARKQKPEQAPARPPAWLCQQFPNHKHWRSWRVCSLQVDEEIGAGLELEPTHAGHRVHDVEFFPGQDEVLCAGTVIMVIDGHPLVGLSEEVLDEVFDARLREGAEVMLMEWDELCEAMEEEGLGPDSDGKVDCMIISPGADDIAMDESATVDNGLPLGEWSKSSGRRVVSGASQKQKKVHEQLESLADSKDEDEDDEREAAPLDRFQRKVEPPRAGTPSERSQNGSTGSAEDAEAQNSRQMFFDLAGPDTSLEIVPVNERSFTSAMRKHAGEHWEEILEHKASELPPNESSLGAQLIYVTDDVEGPSPTPDPSMDMRWVSLEERAAMEREAENRPRQRQMMEDQAVLLDDNRPRHAAESKTTIFSPTDLLQSSRPAPKGRPMAPMPKSRSLGGAATRRLGMGGTATRPLGLGGAATRPLGLGGPATRPLGMGDIAAGSGSFGMGYPLGASSSSWNTRPADDEMGQFCSFRIPKSTGRPPEARAKLEGGGFNADLAKAKPKSVEQRLVADPTVDVD